MNKIELVQKIGDMVCEGCGPDADCGDDPNECFRINQSIVWLDEFILPDAPHTQSLESDGAGKGGCESRSFNTMSGVCNECGVRHPPRCSA